MTSSPRELVSQNTKLQRDQEKLIQDLLGILDDLDNACEHWQQAAQDYAHPAESDLPEENPPQPPALWQRIWYWFVGSPPAVETQVAPQVVPDLEIVASASEGVEMIRRSLLDVLRKQQVLPLEVLGKAFDPARMYAMGRQECANAAENTVVQEVVRGYLWQNRVLREAQVMVSVKPVDQTLE